MSSKKDFENSAIYITQSLIAGLFTILLYPVITNHIEPEVFGVYILATVYASIVIGIANMGCLVGYERNYFVFEKSSGNTGILLSSVQLFVSISYFVFIFIAWIFQDIVAGLLFKDMQYAKLWLLTLIGTCLSSFAQYNLVYLKNSGLAKSYFKVTLVQVFLNFILTYFMLMFDFGVMSLAYALIISNLILCVVLLIHQYLRLSFGFNLHLLKDVLKVSLPLTPKVLFGFLNTQFDKIMLSMLSSMGGVAVYAISQRIALSVFSLMTSLDRVFKPNIYRMLFQSDKRENIGKYLVPFIYVSILPSLLLILFSSEIVNLLVAEEYSDGSVILVVMCIYYSMMFFSKVTSTQLIFAKKTWLTSKLMIVGITLNVLLNIPFIYYWGALGAALATMLASFVITWVYYYYAQKYAKITWEFGFTLKLYLVLISSSLYISLLQFGIINLDYVYVFLSKIIIFMVFIFLGWQEEFFSKKNIVRIKNAIHLKNFN